MNKKSSKLISQQEGGKRKRSTTGAYSETKRIRKIHDVEDSITIHQFIKFCQENNLDKVRHYLSCGVDVNTVADGYWSGLTIAADKN